MTLVEMMVVVALLGILIALTTPIIMTLSSAENHIDNTYSNVGGQTMLSTTLQRLVRSAVAPAPSLVTATHPNTIPSPVPAFAPGTLTPTSMTFYSNVSTPHGPMKVRAWCAAATGGKACAANGAFQITVTPAKKTTCPTTQTSTKTCTFTSGSTHVLAKITHLVSSRPLFVYSYGAPPSAGQPMVTTTVCVSTGTPSGCVSNDTTKFGKTTCAAGTTPAPFANCPAGEIDEVTYDLQINVNSTALNGGLQAEDDTGVFILSSTSTAFAASVG